MSIVKPMKADQIDDLTKLRYPVVASPKLDGIRCLGVAGQAMSTSGKPLPNKALQALFATGQYDGLDGELIVGEMFAEDVFRQTSSIVMSFDKPVDNVTYYVFDMYDVVGTWAQRSHTARNNVRGIARWLEHSLVPNAFDLLRYEESVLAEGAEGVMVRDPQGLYKHGRSTVREGGLLKVKRFVDAEYEVVGFVEAQHNGNTAFLDELGRTKRSSHQENKVGKGTLGSLICRQADGQTFGAGGFTTEMAQRIWDNQEKYLGRMATLKYFPIGGYDVPRFAKFKAFRDPLDLET